MIMMVTIDFVHACLRGAWSLINGRYELEWDVVRCFHEHAAIFS